MSRSLPCNDGLRRGERAEVERLGANRRTALVEEVIRRQRRPLRGSDSRPVEVGHDLQRNRHPVGARPSAAALHLPMHDCEGTPAARMEA